MASLTDSESMCDPCSRLDETKLAIKFCMDCEDKLCQKCVGAHKAIKILMSHHIIDLNLAESIPVKYASQKNCQLHPDLIKDFFCTFHDMLCCPSCIVKEHRTCEKVIPIQEAAKDVKASALITDISDGLKQMVSTCEDIVSNRHSNVKKMQKERKTISVSISSLKEQIIAKLNKMEISVIEKLSNFEEKATSTLKDQSKEAEDLKRKVEEYYQRLEFLVHNGSDNQIFILLQDIKDKLSCENQSMEKLVKRLEELSLSYKETDLLGEIEDLGVVTITTQPCSVKYQQTKYPRAQLLLDTCKTPTAFTLRNIIGVNGSVFGIVSLGDNKLALSNNGKKTIDVYSDDGKLINAVKLDGNRWGLACHVKTGKIITRLRDNTLQIVQDSKVANTIDVPGKFSYGLEWTEDKLFVGGNRELHILQSDFQLLKSIKIGNSYIYYIHYRDGKLFLSDCYSVYCVKEDGTQIFKYNSSELKNPYGITSDGNSNIYVVGRGSNNVHKISTDGKKSAVVLSEKDGINDPITICFSRDYKKLFISNAGGNYVYAFNCEY